MMESLSNNAELDKLTKKIEELELALETANGIIKLYHERVGDLEAATTMKIAYERMIKELRKVRLNATH